MKTLITILLLFNTARAQTYDTVSCIIPVMDTTSFYLIYNSKGKVVNTVTSLQPWSIPSGGWASKDKFVNVHDLNMVGFVVYKTDNTGTEAIKYLSSRKTAIPKPYVVSGWHLPINGVDFKQL